MSDWEWDSRAFVAAPKKDQQEALSSNKKRKTDAVLGLCGVSARPCGGCRAAELEPLEFLRQADNSAGNNSWAKELTGRPLVKTFEALRPNSPSSMSEAVMLQPGHEGSCQADGCNSDMTEQSVWHQKSRICDKHMSGMFLKQGKPQQFCQQCGRSHNLDAFDKGRRSCRTQLAKHAARRRKRSASAINKEPAATTAQVKVVGTPVATGCKAGASIAALACSSDAWLHTLCNNQRASGDLSHAQPLDPKLCHSSGSSDQSLSNSTSLACNSVPVQNEEHTSLLVYDQPVVYTTTTETSERLPPEATPVALQPMCPSLWPPDSVTATAAGLASGPQDDPLQDVLSWQLPPLEENCRPPMSDFDQAFAFMQAGSASAYPRPDVAIAFPQRPAQLQQQPAQQLLPQSVTPLGCTAASRNLGSTSPPLSQVGFAPGSQQALPTNLQSMPVVAQQQQPYTASNAALRMSVKLFNCTPAQLPSTLRESVTGWLGSTPAEVEGYIRPGCVHLTVQATVPAQSGARPGPRAQPPTPELQIADVAVKQVVDHLLASPQQDVWHTCTMVVQLGSEVAVVHQGMPLKVWNVPAHAESDTEQQQQQEDTAEQPACCLLAATRPSRLPVLSLAQPVCLVAGLNQKQAVTATGGGLSGDCKVLCRAGGRHLEVQLSDSKLPSGKLQVLVPCNLSAGLLYLEVQRGSFLGPALPVLVAPTAALAAEAACMLQATLPADQQGLTVDLGCAMLRLSGCNKQSRQQGVAAATSGGPGVRVPICTCDTPGLLALLARAISCGQVEMVKSLMGLLPRQRLPEFGSFRDASGMGLLHLAVRLGSMGVLATLLKNCSAPVWQDGVSGPAGITPFHLAVFLSDAQSFALMLCASLGAHHWFASTTRDGHSPADFAVRCGKDSLSDAITNSAMRASADCACFAGASDDQQPRNRTALLQGETQACSHELHVAASTSVGGWSDSSSSSDDSGSDLEASHHGGSVMSVMPSPGLQPYQVLSAATKFVQDGKERLAAVIRGKWSSY